MPNTKLDRLLKKQDGLCFFCQKKLAKGEASVEHLVAKSKGGTNADQNCVACCRSMNSLLGNKPLKDKLRILLNQAGKIECPKMVSKPRPQYPDEFQRVVAILQKQSHVLPMKLPRLKNVITSLCLGDKSPTKVTALVDRLQATGKIKLEGETITYAL